MEINARNYKSDICVYYLFFNINLTAYNKFFILYHATA